MPNSVQIVYFSIRCDNVFSTIPISLNEETAFVQHFNILGLPFWMLDEMIYTLLLTVLRRIQQYLIYLNKFDLSNQSKIF